MPRFFIFGLFLGLTVALAGEAQTPRVDGHADGATSLSLTLQVIDAESRAPIPDATVTFFNKGEVYMLREIEEMRKAGKRSRQQPPSGKVAHTGPDGTAKLECQFDAAFKFYFESGEKNDIGTDIYPTGGFVVTKPEYSTAQTSAAELFSPPPLSREDIKETVTIQLSKAPQPPPEPVKPRRRR